MWNLSKRWGEHGRDGALGRQARLMPIGALSDAHQNFFRRASEFRPTGIRIPSDGHRNFAAWGITTEHAEITEKGREGGFGRKGRREVAEVGGDGGEGGRTGTAPPDPRLGTAERRRAEEAPPRRRCVGAIAALWMACRTAGRQDHLPRPGRVSRRASPEQAACADGGVLVYSRVSAHGDWI